MRGLSWGVLPLVAGLFVMVEALEWAGFANWLAGELRGFAAESAACAVWVAGPGLALASNAVNNLPAGLLAGRVVALAEAPERVRAAVLIAIDLGPNLSVTGSLATLLWLQALRREGVRVGAWQFLRLGVWVMPPPLLLALAGVWWGP